MMELLKRFEEEAAEDEAALLNESPDNEDDGDLVRRIESLDLGLSCCDLTSSSEANAMQIECLMISSGRSSRLLSDTNFSMHSMIHQAKLHNRS